MKLTSELIMPITLLIVTLGASTYLVFAAYNYDAYYWDARNALLSGSNINIDRLTVTRDTATGNVTVHVTASASNPTGYSGLTLHQFAIVLYFFHDDNLSQSAFFEAKQNLLLNITPDLPLGPTSTLQRDLTLHLDTIQSAAFESFNQTYPSGVNAHTVLTVIVSSFLDPVFGTMNPSKVQVIPIS